MKNLQRTFLMSLMVPLSTVALSLCHVLVYPDRPLRYPTSSVELANRAPWSLPCTRHRSPRRWSVCERRRPLQEFLGLALIGSGTIALYYKKHFRVRSKIGFRVRKGQPHARKGLEKSLLLRASDAPARENPIFRVRIIMQTCLRLVWENRFFYMGILRSHM